MKNVGLPEDEFQSSVLAVTAFTDKIPWHSLAYLRWCKEQILSPQNKVTQSKYKGWQHKYLQIGFIIQIIPYSNIFGIQYVQELYHINYICKFSLQYDFFHVFEDDFY